jgi:hypothetical protein
VIFLSGNEYVEVFLAFVYPVDNPIIIIRRRDGILFTGFTCLIVVPVLSQVLDF